MNTDSRVAALASQPRIEVTQVCFDFAEMTLCRGTHFGEHVRVEVEHQPDRRFDCGVFVETLGWLAKLAGSHLFRVLDERASLHGLRSKACEATQDDLAHAAIVARNDLILQRIVESQRRHDWGHSSDRESLILGDVCLGSEGLRLEHRAIGASVVKPKRPAFQRFGHHFDWWAL